MVMKILVNRLKPHLPNLISHNKNSFIKGRGPDVNIVVATEIFHSMHKKRGKWGWFALKVDLEKAYDRLEWGFVRECLITIGLDTQTITIIMECITHTSSSILINGRKTTSFTHTR